MDARNATDLPANRISRALVSTGRRLGLGKHVTIDNRKTINGVRSGPHHKVWVFSDEEIAAIHEAEGVLIVSNERLDQRVAEYARQLVAEGYNEEYAQSRARQSYGLEKERHMRANLDAKSFRKGAIEHFATSRRG